MDKREQFNKFVAGKEKPRTSLFIIVNAWALQFVGYSTALWSIFCSSCFDNIVTRIFIALLGIAMVFLGMKLRKEKKWALYAFIVLVVIVALCLILRLRIILTAINLFLNK